MNRFPILQKISLCLAVVFIAIAVVLIGSRWKKERKARLAYSSQAFVPQMEVVRGEVPGYSLPGLFEVTTHCVSAGGHGQSQWLVHGQLLDVSGETPHEIWDSKKMTSPQIVSHVTKRPGPMTVADTSKVDFSWRFNRANNNTNQLKFIVEAVAVPLPASEDKLGTRSISIRDASPAEIKSAAHQSGSKYFRKSLLLKAHDDNNYHFSRNKMNP